MAEVSVHAVMRVSGHKAELQAPAIGKLAGPKAEHHRQELGVEVRRPDIPQTPSWPRPLPLPVLRAWANHL